MVATTWGDSIRQLIDVYEEIAEAFGNLVFFRKLLQSREHLRLVLEDYFSDILRFHRCVLDVFSPPGLCPQFHSVYSPQLNFSRWKTVVQMGLGYLPATSEANCRKP
jgi:hypothetical protein